MLNTEDLTFICDDARHLVCKPYSVDNLHTMAEALGIKRCWFHPSKSGAHYDIPKKRVDEIRAKCHRIVSSREILEICQGK